jgi:hypothetical protein
VKDVLDRPNSIEPYIIDMRTMLDNKSFEKGIKVSKVMPGDIKIKERVINRRNVI